MAKRPAKSRLDWMAQRMGAATDELRESSFARDAEERRASPATPGSRALGGAYFDELEALDAEQEEIIRREGEVFGAATGRGRRAISDTDLEDVEWDPQRAYPQMQTHSSNPERPRTLAAGYDPKSRILRVTFREGAIYEYIGPEPRHWSAFQRTPSPGRYIDDVLDQYPYRPLVD